MYDLLMNCKAEYVLKCTENYIYVPEVTSTMENSVFFMTEKCLLHFFFPLQCYQGGLINVW